MILKIVKELDTKNHFLYIDKCHNSVITYQNWPINNSKQNIGGKIAKFERNPFINT